MLKSVFGAVAALGIAAMPALADYPAKDIQGIIQWGAGGSTDTVSRAVTPHAEKVLGGTVVMQNVTGGVGAIGLNKVASSAADGYTLLFGAENPLLYKVMGLGDKDYSDFVPVSILARGVPILVARPDAPFNTFPEMVAHIKANPKAVKFGSTGPGGLPSVVTAMISSKTPLDVTFVPYDGDGPALTALQGGAVDVMPAVLGAAIEAIKGGKMKPIAIFDVEGVPQLPGVPTITATNPEFAEMLPWGPFFGIFVKKGTPDDAVAKLTGAYAEAIKAPDFVQLIDNRGFKMLGLSGAEAESFLADWQSTTAWLIWNAGIAKKSPEGFGIPKK
ncbi:tripartite tricarboxylate transporter substrate binding protein [Gemmobacter sp.]|uniref:tripartite tricarboxylate transporter substrate binding protein n=1 Tax=Gemmobacter sp. TaxID=1898957 RepID=UPI002AFDCA14|nr:tripartite tricarboxylate transporter substrate binding protein [Gemmobacter sp.]